MYSETLQAALMGAEHQDCHLRAFCKTADIGTAVAERLRAKEKGATMLQLLREVCPNLWGSPYALDFNSSQYSTASSVEDIVML